MDILVSIAESLSRKLKDRVDEYIIIVEHNRREMLKLANGEASVTQSWDTIEVSVYATKEKRTLLTGLSVPSPELVVDDILGLIDKLEPSPFYAPLPNASGQSYSLIDKKITSHLNGTNRLDLAHDLEIGYHITVAGMISLGYKRKFFVNSYGETLKGEITTFNGYIRAFKNDRSGQWSWSSTMYDEGRKARRAIQVALELAEECSRLPKEKIEPGKYRLLMSPMVAGGLLNNLALMATGGSIIFGQSFIKPENLGQQVFSDALTLIDRPRDDSLPRYTLFDDEGVETRDKAIIERGILKNILHNTKTAKLMGHTSTGNAGIIMPSPFNLEARPGDISSGELLEALGSGVYATNIWYTRFQNYLDGSFSTVTRDAAFIVKNGKPVACPSRFRITGKLGELFQRIEGMSKEVWELEWWEIPYPTRSPHMLVSEAEITSA